MVEYITNSLFSTKLFIKFNVQNYQTSNNQNKHNIIFKLTVIFNKNLQTVQKLFQLSKNICFSEKVVFLAIL